MKQAIIIRLLPLLLLVDGVVLGFASSIISGLADAPSAVILGVLVLLGDLATAFFAARRNGVLAEGKVTSVILLANALCLAACGLYIGQTDDAPGAALIGFILSASNLIAALLLSRRRGRSKFSNAKG